MDVFDVTDGGTLVVTDVLQFDEIVGELKPSLGGDVDIKLGSATAGEAGGSIGGSIDIPLIRKMIGMTPSFSVHAIMRRGHTYQVKITLQSDATMDAVSGLAVANLTRIDGELSLLGFEGHGTNLFDPDTWLTGLGLNSRALPTLGPLSALGGKLFDFPELDFTLPALSLNLPEFDGYNPPAAPIISQQNVSILSGFDVPFPLPFANVEAMLIELGVPTTVPGIIEEFVGFGQAVLEDGGILDAGVELTQLTVALDNDRVEEIDENQSLIEAVQGGTNTIIGDVAALQATADTIENKTDMVQMTLDTISEMKQVHLEVIEIHAKRRYLIAASEAGGPVDIVLDAVHAARATGFDPIVFHDVTSNAIVHPLADPGLLDVELVLPNDHDDTTLYAFEVSHPHVDADGNITHEHFGVAAFHRTGSRGGH